MPAFVTENRTIAAHNNVLDRAQQELDRQRRQAIENHEISLANDERRRASVLDQAQRTFLAQQAGQMQGPEAGLVRQLSGVEGGGSQGLNVYGGYRERQDRQVEAERNRLQEAADFNRRQSAQRESAMMRGYFQALQSGDMATAQQLGRQVGLEVPPQTLADHRKRQQWAEAGRWQALYGDDVERFGQFLAAALEADDAGPPDYEGAFRAVPPRNFEPNQSRVSGRSDPRETARKVWADFYETFAEFATTPEQQQAAAEKAQAATEQWLRHFGYTEEPAPVPDPVPDPEPAPDPGAVAGQAPPPPAISPGMQTPGPGAAEAPSAAGARLTPTLPDGRPDVAQMVPGEVYETGVGPMRYGADGRMHPP